MRDVKDLVCASQEQAEQRKRIEVAFNSEPVWTIIAKIATGFIVLTPGRDGDEGVTAGSFSARLQTALQAYGLTVQTPDSQNVLFTPNTNPQVRRTAFKARLDAAYGRLNNPQLLVVLLSDTSATTYSDGNCDRGVPTVCIGPEAVGLVNDRGDQGVLGNLRYSKTLHMNDLLCKILLIISSLKINFKLGGTNHRLSVADLPVKPMTMIVGADVTHEGKRDDGCPSLAGVVATCDEEPMYYLASDRLQRNNTEIYLTSREDTC
ncbi:Protein argonaute [Lachnellula subtilissima]|uniref:Protein argonaute n=1 Tax=Lachnellula subtilissima TaxID=602034 RepID=A0A8H8U4B9_9HELO|nr:Protein argonaute [Lachnellula subtilissima]